jgi:putative ABC transport system permease protein
MEELFKVAWRNLTHRRARTMLTLIGVVIGIAAVVALISLGNGLSGAIDQQLKSLGSDKIIVAPKTSGSGFGQPGGSSIRMTNKDVDVVNKVKGVELAIPLLFKSFSAKFGDKTAVTSAIGIPTGDTDKFFSDLQRYEIVEGRRFRKGEKNVAILGSRVSDNLFDGKLKVRDKIEVLGKDIQVIGILKATGNQQDDSGIIMPIETLRDLTNDPDAITYIFAKANDDPKTVAQNIEKELEDFHKEKVFVAYTTEQLIEQINSVFGILSFVLVGIAGISLVVAGFGILNTMLMSVVERTREIGIMKAIGATNHIVLSMFLVESAIVGIIGGAVGVIVGYALSFTLSNIAVNFLGIKLLISIDPFLIAFVLGFAAFVGILSGTYPAYRAAKLDPVEALRYE